MSIPAHWPPRYRPDDEELVGYLVIDGDLVVPMTVFGSPLGPPCDEQDAAALLDSEGLACLADQWRLLDAGTAADRAADRAAGPADGAPAAEQAADGGSAGGGIAVAVVEATPDHVVLRQVDLGNPDGYGTAHEVPVPVGTRLIRDGRLSGSHQAVPARR
ncbi:MAG TPA: hypothetical protein VFM01_10540 [Nakamurella sp.]|nr:hypothetical protein [Nakamurella sp.]